MKRDILRAAVDKGMEIIANEDAVIRATVDKGMEILANEDAVKNSNSDFLCLVMGFWDYSDWRKNRNTDFRDLKAAEPSFK